MKFVRFCDLPTALDYFVSHVILLASKCISTVLIVRVFECYSLFMLKHSVKCTTMMFKYFSLLSNWQKRSTGLLHSPYPWICNQRQPTYSRNNTLAFKLVHSSNIDPWKFRRVIIMSRIWLANFIKPSTSIIWILQIYNVIHLQDSRHYIGLKVDRRRFESLQYLNIFPNSNLIIDTEYSFTVELFLN